MTSGTQPSRVLLIAAGLLTQVIGATCLILGLASIPVIADLKGGMSGVIASVIASLAAIVCGTLVWRGRLVPLALAAGLNVGFGIGLPRGGSAVGAMLRMLPADEAQTAETLVMIAAITMFVGAILCVISVPSALKLRQWARDEIAASQVGMPLASVAMAMPAHVDEAAPTRERPRLGEEYRRPKSNTMRGLGAQKLMPTQVINIAEPGKGKQPAIILAVAVTLIAIGIILITAASGSKPEDIANTSGSADEVTTAISGSANPPEPTQETADGGKPGVFVTEIVDAAPPEPPRVDEFSERFHAALGMADAADLGLLLDSKVFAFGVESNDLAEGRDAVVAQLLADLGGPSTVGVKFAHAGEDGDTAWIAEELRMGSKTFVVTAGLALRDGAWTIVALHWGEAMPNATAYRLAREGNLGVPDAIPNTNDTSELAKAMKTAFASKPSFVEARSTRPNAFNFGSASGERLKGGEAIKKVFGRISATIRLHDSVKVGALGAHGGWGAANVDFTDADKDGTEVSQTFRVLAIWIKEDAGWRIVQTQWSNAR